MSRPPLQIEEVAQGLARFARETWGEGSRCERLEVMAGGHAGLTFGFEAHAPRLPAPRAMILKLAPPGVRRSGNTDVHRQAPLLRALHAAGVPAPDVPYSDAGEHWFGTPFIMMERLAGEPFFAWDPDPGFDRSPAAVAPLWTQCIDALVAMHRFDWRRELPGWEAPRAQRGGVLRWTPILAKSPEAPWVAPGREVHASALQQLGRFIERQTHDTGVRARDRSDHGGGLALDRVAAGLAEGLAGVDVVGDPVGPQPGETHLRALQGLEQAAFARDHHHGGHDPMTAAGQLFEQLDRIGAIGRLAENGAADRHGRVGRQQRRCGQTRGEPPLVAAASLGGGHPDDVGGRRFSRQPGLECLGPGLVVIDEEPGGNTELAQQLDAARTAGGEIDHPLDYRQRTGRREGRCWLTRASAAAISRGGRGGRY